MSEPTWGAGSSDDDGTFTFSYEKANFLGPFKSGILSHFPNKKYVSKLTFPFHWKKYISLNSPYFEKELSMESNPFQIITVKNGYYEMQFSFIQTDEEMSSNFHHKEGKDWIEKDS